MPSVRLARSCTPVGSRAATSARVCFLYIAQAHQVLHSISVASELARSRPDIAVEVAASSSAVLTYAQSMVEPLGPAPISWRLLGPAWLGGLAAPDGVPPKVPVLGANARLLDSYDVIVAPERTTTAVRLMGVQHPRLVYTQHGAGDRGGPFDRRLGRFDLVFAAGAKQRDRMVSEGLVRPERCAVVGYPKFDLVEGLDAPAPRLFAEPRPVVIYNPHFDRRLSSWPRWGVAVLRAFAEQDAYNLIFAPHLRLFQGRPASEVEALAPFRDHPNIHIDLGGGAAAVDMTYTRMADVYLGDVSSQVYEFLRRPKPCAFLNAHGVDWEGDESFRHWRFGPVLEGAGRLVADIDEARATHRAYVALQVEDFRYTFDLDGKSSSMRAAEAIARVATGSGAAVATAGRCR